MAEYLSPNVFIEERKSSAGPVSGVSTSTYATTGWLPKGPTNDPQLISSFEAYTNTFGPYWRNSVVPFTMALFFSQGRGRAYVSRIVPSDATKAALSAVGGASCINGSATSAKYVGKPLPATLDLSTNSKIAIDIDQSGTPTEIDCVGATPAASTREEIRDAIAAIGGIACVLTSDFRLEITSASTGIASELKFSEAAGTDNSPEILGLNFVTGLPTTYTYNGEAALDWTYEAPYEGSWYNQVRMCISGNADYEDANGNFSLFDVEIQEESTLGAADWETKESYTEVVMDDDTSDDFISDVINEDTQYQKILAGTAIGKPKPLSSTQVTYEWADDTDGTGSFSGTLKDVPIVEGSLSMFYWDSTGSAWVEISDDSEGVLAATGVEGTINYTTGAWTLSFTTPPTTGFVIYANYYKTPSATSTCCQLTGGTDGTSVTRSDISEISLSATRKGIYAFNTIDEILNMSLPDFAGDTVVTGDLISYAASRGDRLIIGATPENRSSVEAAKWMRKTALYNSKYLAVYWPWVKIADPMVTTRTKPMSITPDGIIAGVYARNDSLANVGTSPGGINRGAMNGIMGLERTVDQADRDTVYPARLNPLRVDTQAGKAVWGVRTASLDAEWRYINHTRLFMYCEKSLYNASFWVVFENNGPPLWGRVKAQFDSFFKNLYDNGYLAGTTPGEAFLVKVDSDNNPQSAIDAGLLTVDCYIAAHKPAEFVRLRFQQLLQAA